MTVADWVFVGMLVAFGALMWFLLYPRDEPRDILTERAHAKVILTLKSGDAFRGVLREQDARAIVLVNADALGMGERGTDLGVDGELVVLREDVAYLQIG